MFFNANRVTDRSFAIPRITNHDRFARDILVGLSAEKKSIPSKYFYDGEGSKIFSQITEIPEYYLTDCEMEILKAHCEDLSRLIGDDFNLIELGAGDGRKTKVLLRYFLENDRTFTYMPIDISKQAVEDLSRDIETSFQQIPVNGLVTEYFDGIDWIGRQSKRRSVVLFLGSSIGNFSDTESHKFLVHLWETLNDGDLVIIGFDMRKDLDVLMPAYDDVAGVTANFNLNLLDRINKMLGGNFSRDGFSHRARYNLQRHAMESFLVSESAQEVTIERLERRFQFEKNEMIHTEFSYKYSDAQIERLAKHSGFYVEGLFFDQKRWFCDAVWRVHKVY